MIVPEVRVHSFGTKVFSKAMGESAEDTRAGVDPFEEAYAKRGQEIMKPPYNLLYLCRVTEISDILKQCISAMAVNIDGFGYEFVPFIDPAEGEKSDKKSKEAIEEKHKLNDFFLYVNDQQDLTKLRKETREDLEATGMAYWEIIRNKIGEIAEIYQLPSHSCRLTAPDKVFTNYDQKVVTSEGEIDTVPRKRRFRRVVQLLSDRTTKIYFKEFGDPRDISRKNGKVLKDGEEAHEVIIFEIPCNYSPYGLPRWIGMLMSILGSRKAEEVNFLFFDNKSIPPMVVTVSGGGLTKETLDKLEHMFDKELKGLENFHRILLLEAVPHSASDIPGEKVSPVRIEIKPLTEYIQKDALFIEYRGTIRTHVRSAFKLAPIYTGDTTDYTRATALESARVCEEQVFQPERNDFDYMVNRLILPNLGINKWKLRTLGGNTSDGVGIVKALGMIKEAIPVGILQEAVAQMRNVPVGVISEELYDMTLAELKAKVAPTPIAPSDDEGSEEDEDEKNQKEEEKFKKFETQLLEKVQKIVDETA